MSTTAPLQVKYFHEKPGLCTGNIIWAQRDRGSAYYPVSRFAGRGKFTSDHPCCPNGGGSNDQGEFGNSESLSKFRRLGYWASCFPEGDGITMRCLKGQEATTVIADIKECFGWEVVKP